MKQSPQKIVREICIWFHLQPSTPFYNNSPSDLLFSITLTNVCSNELSSVLLRPLIIVDRHLPNVQNISIFIEIFKTSNSKPFFCVFVSLLSDTSNAYLHFSIWSFLQYLESQKGNKNNQMTFIRPFLLFCLITITISEYNRWLTLLSEI